MAAGVVREAEAAFASDQLRGVVWAIIPRDPASSRFCKLPSISQIEFLPFNFAEAIFCGISLGSRINSARKRVQEDGVAYLKER